MFDKYRTQPFYDEMFKDDMKPRAHYSDFYNILQRFTEEELKEKFDTAQSSFLRQGITFTVYSNDMGTERTMPFDFIPAIIPACDWEMVEAGMKQRIKALNMFLKDIYNDQQIINDGIVPRDLVENNAYYYHKQVKGVELPLDNHIFLAGIDLIRDEKGIYRVLEDNLRNPSGMSYVYQNRIVMRRIFPEFFAPYNIQSLEHQLSYFYQAIVSHIPRCCPLTDEICAVLLTPGVYNSAYYDHVFLAQHTGLELVQGTDLLVKNNIVYMKTTRGLKRVDIIYRRIDDDYLDPLHFNPDSLLGVPGLLDAYRSGNVAILNGIGNGVADDKAVYAYVPEMIRYYLNEEPLIANVDTYMLHNAEQRKWVLDRLEQMVIKNVGASGGYDMLIGPQASDEEINSFRKKIIETPNQYIAQPTIKLSRAPAYGKERFYPCHVDLRVFVMQGVNTHILPGGLSRVALKEGSLVVNSSQGGGGKDTWVLEAKGESTC